jgi:organic radical activating enzyme
LGGEYGAGRLAETALSLWPDKSIPFIVCTGGEPLLQLDDGLISALKLKGCVIALETNGTIPAPPGIDWITVSPKIGAPLCQTHGDELKLVYPQGGIDPSQYEGLGFDHFFLQPLDSPKHPDAARMAVAYCLAHPKWRLSAQAHKALGIK